MKKITFTYTAIALLLGGATSLTAGSHMGKDMPGKHMQTAGPDKCTVCKMHGKMMNRKVVPTEDGGIVILMGPYLLKYDSELNLVRKTEIDFGPEDMKKIMDRRNKMQEMMQEMMKDASRDQSK